MLRLRGLGKRYAAPVLADVDLDLAAGEVHALMGANGAGKSTLAKIVSGLVAADSGTMHLAGEAYRPRTRREAQRAGVQIVLQEPNLIPTLSVAENLFLADLPRRAGIVAATALRAQAASALRAVGLEALDPRPAGRPARRRPAAARRAGGGAGAPVPRADPRRADRGADRCRDRAGVRAPAPPRRGGHRDPLHQPPARGDSPAVSSRHRAPRRPDRRRAGRRGRRRSRRWSG